MQLHNLLVQISAHMLFVSLCETGLNSAGSWQEDGPPEYFINHFNPCALLHMTFNLCDVREQISMFLLQFCVCAEDAQ